MAPKTKGINGADDIQKRQELEERLGLIAQGFSVAAELAEKQGDGFRIGEEEDYFLVAAALRDLPLDRDREDLELDDETLPDSSIPEDWDGVNRSIPFYRSRRQVQAAAGIFAMIETSVTTLGMDDFLDSHYSNGWRDIAKTIEVAATDGLVEMGRILRQPGDVLEVGMKEFSDYEVEWWKRERERAQREREGLKRSIHNRVNDAVESALHWDCKTAEGLEFLREELQRQIEDLEENANGSQTDVAAG